VTIDTFPDDVLVDVFNFYVNIDDLPWPTSRNTWHALVHVCRRWRYLVFASPRRLNLQLEYGGHRPMSGVLDAWPVLPVILKSGVEFLPSGRRHPKWNQRWDNMIAALESERYNRICQICISDMTNSRWERFAAAMQKPFPQMTRLEVTVFDVVSILPDLILGGSAPRLRALWLRGIPFPSVPKLLLSANGLVTLLLWDIPNSGYISPDAMATALTAMIRLETLDLRFHSLRSLPDPESRPLPPLTRFVLPALIELTFKGVYEYLEALLTRIDTPLLHYPSIVFFMDLEFDVPQLHRLIGHAEEFKTFDHGEVLILDFSIRLYLYPPKTGVVDHNKRIEIQISCRELDWQLSSFAQVCSFSLISALEELEIREYDFLPSSHWKDDMEDAQWLELLDPFTALKNLHLIHGIAQHVCGALQELSRERATEVLPVLRSLFVRGFSSLQPVQEAMMALC